MDYLPFFLFLLACFASFAAGFIIASGRKFNAAKQKEIAAAAQVCPHCRAKIRGEHGRFVKPSFDAS